MNAPNTSSSGSGTGSSGASGGNQGGGPGTTTPQSTQGTGQTDATRAGTGTTPGTDNTGAGTGRTPQPSLAAGETPPKEGDASEGAPEKYEPFTLPEGVTLDEKALGDFQTFAKESNLSQETAQKLVDFHTAALKDISEGQMQHWQDTQEEWQEALRDDPDVGGTKLSQNIANLGKIYAMMPVEMAGAAKEGLNLTGAGNHPGVVKMFMWMAAKMTEGQHVKGTTPSKSAPQSIAAAMYPHLVNKGT